MASIKNNLRGKLFSASNFLFTFLFFSFSFHTSKAQSYDDTIAKFREDYKNELLLNPHPAVLKEDFSFFKYYPADKNFKVTAKFTRTPDSKQFEMSTYNKRNARAYLKYGFAEFVLNGRNIKISVYQNTGNMIHPVYKDYLFVPFKDLTNGTTTYEGGRYIDILISDIKNDNVVIDFNKAYNPYCSYSSGYSCPIPPEENNLSIEIKAGEMKFGKEEPH